MAIQNVYKLDKIKFPSSVEIHTLGNFGVKQGIKSFMGKAAGQVWDNFVATEKQQPQADFTTKQIDVLLGAIGIGGASNSSAITWYQKQASATGYQARTATAHKSFAVNNWLAYWTSLKLPHAGQAEAQVTVMANYDGTNDPIIYTGSVALSGNLAPSNYFGSGPCYVNMTAIPGVQEITFQNQVKLIQAGSDNEEFDTFIGIESIQTDVTIKTFQPVNWETLNLQGIALAGNTTAGASGLYTFARKYKQGGSRVSNGTAEHILLAMPQGRAIPVDDQGNESGPISYSLKIEGAVIPLSSITDASLPLTITLSQAIAAPSV